MLKVYADYDAIAKAGKLNELTIPELVKFLNEQKTVLTAEQSQNVTTTLNKAVENNNKAACDNKCAEFCAMERSEMWRSYATWVSRLPLTPRAVLCPPKMPRCSSSSRHWRSITRP